MKLSRRNFIGSGACAKAFAAMAADVGPERPELRFGLISDAHFSRNKGVADKRFRVALEWFRSKDVDAVVCTGDLTNCGMRAELENLASVWKDVFPNDCMPDGRRIEKVFLCGNHDTDPGMAQIAKRRGYEDAYRATAIQNDSGRRRSWRMP
jgi:3',5'-cyclic AMP phosphodiesterase CpdA